MINRSAAQEGQRAEALIAGTTITVVTVAVLYWAQSIFIPVALAVFLTFLLSPLVALLRRCGIGRTPAVILVVCFAAAGLGFGGWMVTVQISSLVKELPQHTQNIKKKVRSLKSLAGGSSRLSKMIHEINQELAATPSQIPMGDSHRGDEAELKVRRPEAVFIEPQGPRWLSQVAIFLSPLAEQLGQLALAMILVVFMLQRREELRNRIIRLVGHGRIVAATRFVDEAGQRISRFLLMQAIVNGTFGLLFGFGLRVLGVKFAVILGFLGAVLRYLPYVGVYLAGVLAVSSSLAMTDGWSTTVLVIVLLLALEMIVANLVEPRLYGQSMGVSDIAVLVSAAMWAFLWGPIGLVLSSPLTVCLVTLSRYVPQLGFLDVLLGDAPALEPEVSFYQRLLARDQDEALELILERVKTVPAEAVYDTMLVPALCAAKASRGRDEISEADERYLVDAIREIIDDMDDLPAGTSAAEEKRKQMQPAETSSLPRPLPIFGCAARDDEDRVGMEMLARLLDPLRWKMELIAQETLISELLDRVAESKPAVVCISALPPGGLAHTRYLCKRLRGRFPELRIIVGRWGQQEELAQNALDLEEAGALHVAGTLLETRQQLAASCLSWGTAVTLASPAAAPPAAHLGSSKAQAPSRAWTAPQRRK
jgi:predicted PurR-regulated permease PerM